MRSARITSALLLLLVASACRQADSSPAERFGHQEAERARRALDQLPLAVELFRGGRYGRAEKRFAHVLATLPPIDQATPAAEMLHLRGPGEFRRLRSSLETNIGLCRLRSRRYDGAMQILQQAVRSDPGSPTAHSNLGVAQLRVKRYAEARRTLTTALRLGSDGARLHLHLGEAALRDGDPQAARRALRQSVRAAAAQPSVDTRGTALDAQRWLAEVALAEGRPRQARRRLEAVLAARPGDAQSRYLLLRALARLGDDEALRHHRMLFENHAAALAAVQSALGESPQEVAGLHWIADTYLRLGLDHLAAVHFRQLQVRDPSDAVARRGLRVATLRSRQGRP